MSDVALESERRELASQAALARSIGPQDPIVLLESGRPVHGILDIAHSHADTLVVTGAGRTGLAALGSVSERVGARARCSVLALRHRA